LVEETGVLEKTTDLSQITDIVSLSRPRNTLNLNFTVTVYYHRKHLFWRCNDYRIVIFRFLSV
jgi:hypothetical protein